MIINSQLGKQIQSTADKFWKETASTEIPLAARNWTHRESEDLNIILYLKAKYVHSS